MTDAEPKLLIELYQTYNQATAVADSVTELAAHIAALHESMRCARLLAQSQTTALRHKLDQQQRVVAAARAYFDALSGVWRTTDGLLVTTERGPAGVVASGTLDDLFEVWRKADAELREMAQ